VVKGLEVFRNFFKDYVDSYVLIGGAACDEHISEAGLTFRATKDLDIVLVVEALNAEFVRHFWNFIEAGRYADRQKSESGRKHYRFFKPQDDKFPGQLEFFARNPDMLDLAADARFTPIPVSEDLSSLSAILMSDDYYYFTIKNSEIEGNLHRATPKSLICLKAKAYLDLKTRKENGETIDERDIKKHKNDVVRLALLLTGNDLLELSESIANDMRVFLDALENDPPDYKVIGKVMGIPDLDGQDVLNRIYKTYSL
jgi:hypothetical protein